jgi:hypothetical protein
MEGRQNEILFIQGVQKTGTSTLVGILNCHPEIFMLYEMGMYKTQVSKYGNQLLKELPEARRLFRNYLDIGIPYKNLAGCLKKHIADKNYRYVGDKIISLDPKETRRSNVYKTIYTMRDVRTWLCKEQIINHYRTDLDVVPVAIDYLRFIIGTYKHPDCLRIRLEDLIDQNNQVLSSITSFLGLDLVAFADNWWMKIGRYEDGDPKKLIEWLKVHPSSKIKPNKMDTTVELISNAFWDDILPVFDKYYYRDGRVDYSIDEVNNDLDQLEDLMKHSPLPLEECYKYISTQRLGAK